MKRHTSEIVGGVVLDFRGSTLWLIIQLCPAESGYIISRDQSIMVFNNFLENLSTKITSLFFFFKDKQGVLLCLSHPAVKQVVSSGPSVLPIKLHFGRLDPSGQSDPFSPTRFACVLGISVFLWFRAQALGSERHGCEPRVRHLLIMWFGARAIEESSGASDRANDWCLRNPRAGGSSLRKSELGKLKKDLNSSMLLSEHLIFLFLF